MGVSVNLTHHFLIAMPSMADPHFAHTLTYVCEHNPEGALGIVINKPIDMTLSALFEQINVPLADLALRESRGEIPDLRRMSVMDNDAIIATLVPVRGIGRWTVEMMLMFRLGRPDVLPVDDLGVRKGAQLVDKLEAMPAPKALLERGERWGPYRTYASLYLWRIADTASKAKPAVKRSQD